MFAEAVAVLAAASPVVDAQVVDRAGRVVGPRSVRVGALRVRSDGRTCRLRAGLPVGVLGALRVPFGVEGSCSSLYVDTVLGQRERGTGGWVYKVGRRLPGVSASAPSARLRPGRRVTWFWCSVAGRCARTLETRAAISGGTLRIAVAGYDDRGRGAAVPGAAVTVGRRGVRGVRRLTTDGRGRASVPVEAGGRYVVRASRRGLVPAFPEEVRAR